MARINALETFGGINNHPPSQITPEAIKADATSLQNPPSIDFDKYLIDLSDEVPEPIPLVSISGDPLFTRGNISCITGKAKSRKSSLTALFASQFLNADEDGNVVIFDTEQNLYYVHKTARRIHRLMEWDEKQNDDRLRVFFLREETTEMRLEVFKEVILRLRPALVFLDGVRDILKSINNEEECSAIINILLNLSSATDCHICAIIHENPSSDKERGWIGTEIVNKSETVVSVAPDGDNISVVSPKFCKGKPFEKFYIRTDANGLPEYCDPKVKPKNTKKLTSLFSEILPTGVTLSYGDLRSKIMDKRKIVDKSAEKNIQNAIEQSIIIKNNVGLYYSAEINKNLSIDDESLPF